MQSQGVHARGDEVGVASRGRRLPEVRTACHGRVRRAAGWPARWPRLRRTEIRAASAHRNVPAL